MENGVQSKLRVVALLFFVAATHYPADAQEAPAPIEFFPGSKVFPLFTADGLSHQFSVSRVTDNRDWIAAIGGSIPLAELRLPAMTMQGSVAVTIFNRLIKTPGHLTVYTIDYKVDIPIDFRFSELALRVAAGHISSHFADDAIELLGKKSIQHVNDYVTLAAAYDLAAIHGYVYAGCNYSYSTVPIPNRPWLFQVGAEFANVGLFNEVSMYGAVDVKVKEEVGWGSTRSFQLGFKLFQRHNYGLRLAYTLRMGYEDRGQFYLSQETRNLLSAYIDF